MFTISRHRGGGFKNNNSSHADGMFFNNAMWPHLSCVVEDQSEVKVTEITRRLRLVLYRLLLLEYLYSTGGAFLNFPQFYFDFLKNRHNQYVIT